MSVDHPDEVFKAIKPSMRRPLDGYEESSMRAYMPFFYGSRPYKADGTPYGDSEIRGPMRRDWAKLLESGTIADPTQIFLELAR